MAHTHTDPMASAILSWPTTAGDIMTSPAVSVSPATSVREVAGLLLENRISALPVVGGSGELLGMVSEGDLFGRNENDRLSSRDWWMVMLSTEGQDPRADIKAAALRRAQDVMHSPVITISADASVRAVAEMLRTHRFKRMPVMRDGQMVGIVSRADLLRVVDEIPRQAQAIQPPPSGLVGLIKSLIGAERHDIVASNKVAPPAVTPQIPAPVKADAFRLLVEASLQAKLDEKSAAAQATELERQRLVKAMLHDHIETEIWTTLIDHARIAAAHGATEYQLLRFPSDLCSDGGRKIDVAEIDWPGTLRGEAADIYGRWERELKPAQFGLSARILDWPHGKPGDIGLILTWTVEQGGAHEHESSVPVANNSML